MNLSFDLHTHSTISDGALSPINLVKRAHEKGVNVLALTDHDAVDGVAEARGAAREVGIYLVSGVEISVTWRRGVVHIVGLNIDTENPQLLEGLEEMRRRRELRAKKIAQKLEKFGIADAYEGAMEMGACDALTRTHFARLLVERGHAKDMQDAFNRWLGRKAKAYVGGEWASLREAVTWINDAGGQSVIAHPIRYKYTLTKLGELISEFKDYGGVAMEVVSSSHNVQERARMGQVAIRQGLLASAGSDFHSPGNPRIDLGQYLKLPSGVQPVWHDWDLPDDLSDADVPKAADA